MKAIHKPGKRTWIDPEIINVRDFLEKWSDALDFKNLESNSTCLKTLVSKEEYAIIEEECGLDALQCRDEVIEGATSITIPSDIDLETVNYQAEELERRKNDLKYANAHYTSFKRLNYPSNEKFIELPSADAPSTSLDAPGTSGTQNCIVTPEVVLRVQFFHPDKRRDPGFFIGHHNLASFSIDQEFLVLGCQFLSELRDKIECVSDKTIPGEFSDYPNLENALTCKEIYKSGFFYINDVFYNDMRDRDCRDYSETIIKWAQKGDRGIGPFKKAILEKTRFIDLDIQLGFPYVYVHQGDCEHLFVFSDIRMFSNSDVNEINKYPLYMSIKPAKRVFCMLCHVYAAFWVVYDNMRLPENPYFFCKICFTKFNYDDNNQKIGTFRAYHFPDFSKLC